MVFYHIIIIILLYTVLHYIHYEIFRLIKLLLDVDHHPAQLLFFRCSSQPPNKQKLMEDFLPTSERDIVNMVNRQKAAVVYYSLAAGFVYLWLIIPIKGIVKFHQVRIKGLPTKYSLIFLVFNILSFGWSWCKNNLSSN